LAAFDQRIRKSTHVGNDSCPAMINTGLSIRSA